MHTQRLSNSTYRHKTPETDTFCQSILKTFKYVIVWNPGILFPGIYPQNNNLKEENYFLCKEF